MEKKALISSSVYGVIIYAVTNLFNSDNYFIFKMYFNRKMTKYSSLLCEAVGTLQIRLSVNNCYAQSYAGQVNRSSERSCVRKLLSNRNCQIVDWIIFYNNATMRFQMQINILSLFVCLFVKPSVSYFCTQSFKQVLFSLLSYGLTYY